jgi:hypothetical protein
MFHFCPVLFQVAIRATFAAVQTKSSLFKDMFFKRNADGTNVNQGDLVFKGSAYVP